MNKYGHPGLQASPLGFVVHLEKCWLGASSDAWVTDPSFTLCKAIAELKCPYTKLGISPEESYEDTNFCCALVNGKVQLKRKHIYYDQVQLQLYVASDLCHWCDFCVYTTKSVVVERIFPDTSWQKKNCPTLDTYVLTVYYLNCWILSTNLVITYNNHWYQLHNGGWKFTNEQKYSVSNVS